MMETHEVERVTVEEYGEWRCLCGNVASSEGFHPCDVRGDSMEPEPGWEDLYRCDRCGRIILQAWNGEAAGIGEPAGWVVGRVDLKVFAGDGWVPTGREERNALN